jgi:hypothetical protein
MPSCKTWIGPVTCHYAKKMNTREPAACGLFVKSFIFFLSSA